MIISSTTLKKYLFFFGIFDPYKIPLILSSVTRSFLNNLLIFNLHYPISAIRQKNNSRQHLLG